MIGNERQPLIPGRDRVEAESNLGAEPLNDEQKKEMMNKKEMTV